MRKKQTKLIPSKSTELDSYGEILLNLISYEQQYAKQLNMTYLFLRNQIRKRDIDQDLTSAVFGDFTKIYKLSLSLLVNLDEILKHPDYSIGVIIFDDLREVLESEWFSEYIENVMCDTISDKIKSVILACEEINNPLDGELQMVFKYYLPILLMTPLHHYLKYIQFINRLMKVSKSEGDQIALQQVKDLIFNKLVEQRKILTTLASEFPQIFHNKVDVERTSEKLKEVKSIIGKWKGKNLKELYATHVKDATVLLADMGMFRERKIFLFDDLLILCKPLKRKHVRWPFWKRRTCYLLQQCLPVSKIKVEDFSTSNNTCLFKIIYTDSQKEIILKVQDASQLNIWLRHITIQTTKLRLDREMETILDFFNLMNIFHFELADY